MADALPTRRKSRSEWFRMLRYETARLCGRDIPAPAGVLPELRRWYWRFVRGYEYEICNECGRAVGASSGPTWWSAPDWLWERVMGSPNGVLCMPCFAVHVDAAGYGMHWTMVGGADCGDDHVPRTSPEPLPLSIFITEGRRRRAR